VIWGKERPHDSITTDATPLVDQPGQHTSFYRDTLNPNKALYNTGYK